MSPGVDPSDILNNFAWKQSPPQNVENVSLGRGQSEIAKKYLKEGAEKGSWVFLANCHLSISLLPELEASID